MLDSPATPRRETLSVSHASLASPDAVWRLLSEGTRVERWFPWVAATVVEDPAEGGRRRIELEDGSSFDEYVVINDASRMTYQYYAQRPPLPIQHVIGTHRIERGVDGATTITWSVSFDVLPAAPQDIVKTMRELYLAALARIDAAARSEPR